METDQQWPDAVSISVVGSEEAAIALWIWLVTVVPIDQLHIEMRDAIRASRYEPWLQRRHAEYLAAQSQSTPSP